MNIVNYCKNYHEIYIYFQKRTPAAKRSLYPDMSKKRRYNLGAVYERNYNSIPEQLHFAEADVLTLLKCVIAQKHKFIDFVELNAKPFSDVQISWMKGIMK